MSGILVAVDGGATRTRAVAFDEFGKALAEAEAGPSNHLSTAWDTVRDSLRQAIGGALEACGARAADLRLVSVGLAGVDYDGAGADDARGILAEAGYRECTIFGDMVIGHAGALNGRPGVMALAGTGAVFLGLDGAGRWAKAGGWGYLFGDEGSAYWIGRMAVAAAARAYDGRGPATRLEEAVCARLGIASFAEAIQRIYGGSMQAREFAALAPLVEDAAEAGDTEARAILDQAGEELARGAEALIRRLGLTEPDVSWQGAVLHKCRLVRERFVDALSARVPGVQVSAPAHRPVFGAWILGARALGWKAAHSAAVER